MHHQSILASLDSLSDLAAFGLLNPPHGVYHLSIMWYHNFKNWLAKGNFKLVLQVGNVRKKTTVVRVRTQRTSVATQSHHGGNTTVPATAVASRLYRATGSSPEAFDGPRSPKKNSTRSLLQQYNTNSNISHGGNSHSQTASNVRTHPCETHHHSQHSRKSHSAGPPSKFECSSSNPTYRFLSLENIGQSLREMEPGNAGYQRTGSIPPHPP